MGSPVNASLAEGSSEGRGRVAHRAPRGFGGKAAVVSSPLAPRHSAQMWRREKVSANIWQVSYRDEEAAWWSGPPPPQVRLVVLNRKDDLKMRSFTDVLLLLLLLLVEGFFCTLIRGDSSWMAAGIQDASLEYEQTVCSVWAAFRLDRLCRFNRPRSIFYVYF